MPRAGQWQSQPRGKRGKRNEPGHVPERGGSEIPALEGTTSSPKWLDGGDAMKKRGR
ncbi:MAG: hypothetical protein KA250_18865 [Verrucomicrobiales bacterium]|nr:hypothetical protein [Verrucomicrobiales bacterium]